MSATVLFYIILVILVVNFLWDKYLEYLNAKRFDDPIPEPLSDIYDHERYEKSQAYKKEKYRFSWITGSVSIVATLLFFFLDGFEFVDRLARSLSSNNISIGLLFFGIILGANALLSLPFSYYHTFVIEERYGFNKTTLKTFLLDKIKGALLGIVVGGGLYALIVWLYHLMGPNFWLYAWAVLSLFSIAVNMLYARIIVPLFNKQNPLPAGSLREKIEAYASKVGFDLKNIFVIDGSKRSTKANAYFSGFGREKRVTLYDTLINDLEEDEIVAVLAHEVGHYKKHHILYNLAIGIASSGILLWLFSLFVGKPIFSEALGVAQPSFHIGIIAFGLLYTPISEVLGLAMNYLSRVFEYQADAYAKATYSGEPLVSALKKLSKNSLSNLTPHPLFVKVHYSHPTLLQRFDALKKQNWS